MAKIVLSGNSFIDLTEIDISELYDQSSSIHQSNTLGVIDVTDPIDNEHFAFVVGGTGFTTYDSHGWATAGTINSFSYVVSTAGVRMDLTKLNVDAADLEDSIKDGTTLTFIDLLWGHADKVTLNKGGAAFHAWNGNDKVTGGNGFDTIWGDNGNDTLSGGGSPDIMYGGLGRDTLSGGGSSDAFIYTNIIDSTTGSIDTITDLHIVDMIVLDAIDADETLIGNQDFVPVLEFTGVAGQFTVKYQAGKDRTVFSGDTDGDGDGDLIIYATGDQSGHDNIDY
jgi:Ca2+-binding RTX toxin-like protein